MKAESNCGLGCTFNAQLHTKMLLSAEALSGSTEAAQVNQQLAAAKDAKQDVLTVFPVSRSCQQTWQLSLLSRIPTLLLSLSSISSPLKSIKPTGKDVHCLSQQCRKCMYGEGRLGIARASASIWQRSHRSQCKSA